MLLLAQMVGCRCWLCSRSLLAENMHVLLLYLYVR
jgi:hypothetical protein